MIDILARVILEEQTNKRQGIHKTQKIKLLRIKERKEKICSLKNTTHDNERSFNNQTNFHPSTNIFNKSFIQYYFKNNSVTRSFDLLIRLIYPLLVPIIIQVSRPKSILLLFYFSFHFCFQFFFIAQEKSIQLINN